VYLIVINRAMSTQTHTNSHKRTHTHTHTHTHTMRGDESTNLKQ